MAEDTEEDADDEEEKEEKKLSDQREDNLQVGPVINTYGRRRRNYFDSSMIISFQTEIMITKYEHFPSYLSSNLLFHFWAAAPIGDEVL